METTLFQGKYWQYHDALYTIEYQEFLSSGNNEHTGNLNSELFGEIASDLKMNADQFLQCFDSQKYKSEVEKDINEAKSAMSRLSTPTIFVNDKIFQGALPYSTFKDAIDAARTIFERSRVDGFGFDVEVFVVAERNGMAVTEVPVQVENSTRSTVHVVRDASRLVADLFRVRRWAREGAYQAGS
mgnify:CR=1 FL=1